MVKYNRSYTLTAEVFNPIVSATEKITIKLPFTLEFNVDRNILSSSNTATFRIMNLAPNTRDKLRKDQFNWNQFRSVTLNAGYATSDPSSTVGNQVLPTIFDGNINQAWSVREGVNFITQIECYDGGFAHVNGKTNTTFQRGIPQKEVITSLIGDLPKVTQGKVGNFPGVLSRGSSQSGTTVDLLRELTGGNFFIDNGKAHALNDNECFVGDLAVINSDTGLLGTPVLEETFLRFNMLFEPRLLIGQLVTLVSSTASQFNGNYKVISVKHRGTISGSVCGDAITSVGLAYGLGELVPVP